VSHPIAHKALRPIAILEASKGFVILAAGFGLLSFLGRDADEFAEQLVLRAHLNPAHHYPQVFIQAMAEVTDSGLWLLAGIAALCATVRFVEAYGLWNERRWAEWLAALSGGIYIPLEIYELFQRITWVRASALAINVAIVAYMAWLLTESLRKRAAAEKKLTAGG
jgi:uncharacterized membrane protein (DUF2068 family)